MTMDGTYEVKPTWAYFLERVTSEKWLAAITLLGVDPQGVVRRDVARWLEPSRNAYRGERFVMINEARSGFTTSLPGSPPVARLTSWTRWTSWGPGRARSGAS